MNVEFEDKNLDRLEIDTGFDAGWPQAIVRAFRKLMNMIRQAPDERVFRNSRGVHYEKLEGDRKGQHSMRLNDQYRLLICIKQLDNRKTVVIIGIEDYH
jgi:proteic killer suppression protein